MPLGFQLHAMAKVKLAVNGVSLSSQIPQLSPALISLRFRLTSLSLDQVPASPDTVERSSFCAASSMQFACRMFSLHGYRRENFLLDTGRGNDSCISLGLVDDIG